MSQPVKLKGGVLADLPATLEARDHYLATDAPGGPRLYVGPPGGGAPAAASGTAVPHVRGYGIARSNPQLSVYEDTLLIREGQGTSDTLVMFTQDPFEGNVNDVWVQATRGDQGPAGAVRVSKEINASGYLKIDISAPAGTQNNDFYFEIRDYSDA